MEGTQKGLCGLRGVWFTSLFAHVRSAWCYKLFDQVGSHLCLQPVTHGKLLGWQKGDQDFELCRHECESQGGWCLFCSGWGGFEGFKLLLVNSFLGLLLSASFVLETRPDFSRNGPSPPSWPRRAMPPAQSCFPKREKGLEGQTPPCGQGTHWSS